MAGSSRLSVAREGWRYVAAFLALGVVGYMVLPAHWSWPFWLAALGLVFAFRESERRIPPSPLAVVSPVDGTVTRIEEGTDPYLKRPSWKIRVRVNWSDEYLLLGPIEGKILNQWFTPRGELPPLHDMDESETYHTEKIEQRDLVGMWIQTDEQDDVVMVMRLRHWPKPTFYGHVGERVGQGQRFGFLPFGGELSLLIPVNSRLKVVEKDRVQAGSSILATFVHETKTGPAPAV